MSKDLSLDLKQILPKVKIFWSRVSKHMAFIITIGVLLVFLIVVWKINSLSKAEPSDAAEQVAESSVKVPKFDQKTINQIQSLENNSPAVHSLFDQARNNPFKE